MKATVILENEKEIKKFMSGKFEAEQTEEDIEEPEYTQEEAERYKTASDLANVCEYLEDSEIIKIRLIISKCEARKEAEK